LTTDAAPWHKLSWTSAGELKIHWFKNVKVPYIYISQREKNTEISQCPLPLVKTIIAQ